MNSIFNFFHRHGLSLTLTISTLILLSGCGKEEANLIFTGESSSSIVSRDSTTSLLSVPPPSTSPNKAITFQDFPAGYDRLIFNDDFTESSFDNARWNMENNGAGGGNNEQQYYRNSAENVFIKKQADPQKNTLVIRALKQSYGGKAYTSGRVNTLHKFYFTYGRVDFRAKLPVGAAMWPSTWMLPSDRDVNQKPWRQDVDPSNSMYIQGFYGGWPASGEIDVMELWGTNPRSISGSLNYATWNGPRAWVTASYNLNNEDYSQKFHTFSIDWQPNVITFLVDDQVYQTRRPQDLNGPWRFDKPFVLIMNVAISPNINAGVLPYPQDMEVDYVRVFQKSSMPEARYYSVVPLPVINPGPTPSNGLITSQLNTGLCIGVRGGAGVNAAAVQLEPCSGANNQQITFAANGELHVLGKCISDAAYNITNGNPINIWDCHLGGDQVWVVNGKYISLKAHPNKCLTYPGNTATSGTQLVISDCVGGVNQQWNTGVTIPPPPSGIKTVASVLDTSKCVDVAGANPNNGTAVQLYTCNGTNAQKINFLSNGELVVLGKCISDSAYNLTNGNPINIWDCHLGPDQVWSVVGKFIKLRANPDKCLTLSGGNTANSTPLVIWDCNGGLNQQWIVN